MHDKRQLQKLQELTHQLVSKSEILNIDLNSKIPEERGMIGVRLSELYSLRMALVTISTVLNMYSRDVDKMIKCFDQFYISTYQGELTNITHGSYILTDFRNEYEKLQEKISASLLKGGS